MKSVKLKPVRWKVFDTEYRIRYCEEDHGIIMTQLQDGELYDRVMWCTPIPKKTAAELMKFFREYKKML